MGRRGEPTTLLGLRHVIRERAAIWRNYERLYAAQPNVPWTLADMAKQRAEELEWADSQLRSFAKRVSP